MDRDTCVFETLDDRRNEFDSKHFAVVQLEPGVSALRKAGWSAKFDYQPYQSGGHKGTGGLRIWVGVQSNPAATTSPPHGKGIRRAGLHLSGCFSGIVTVPNTSASQEPT